MKTGFFIILVYYLLTGLQPNDEKITSDRSLDLMISEFKSSGTDSLRLDKLKQLKNFLNLSKDSIAIIAWNDLLEYCREKDYYHESGYCANQLAIRYRANGDYFISYQSFNQSFIYLEHTNDTSELALSYNGMGGLLADLSYYEQSYDFYTKSARLYNEIKDTVSEAVVYLNVGGMLEEQGKLDSAKYFLYKSRNLLGQRRKVFLLNCYLNLGIVFSKEGNSDSAF